MTDICQTLCTAATECNFLCGLEGAPFGFADCDRPETCDEDICVQLCPVESDERCNPLCGNEEFGSPAGFNVCEVDVDCEGTEDICEIGGCIANNPACLAGFCGKEEGLFLGVNNCDECFEDVCNERCIADENCFPECGDQTGLGAVLGIDGCEVDPDCDSDFCTEVCTGDDGVCNVLCGVVGAPFGFGECELDPDCDPDVCVQNCATDEVCNPLCGGIATDLALNECAVDEDCEGGEDNCAVFCVADETQLGSAGFPKGCAVSLCGSADGDILGIGGCDACFQDICAQECTEGNECNELCGKTDDDLAKFFGVAGCEIDADCEGIETAAPTEEEGGETAAPTDDSPNPNPDSEKDDGDDAADRFLYAAAAILGVIGILLLVLICMLASMQSETKAQERVIMQSTV